MFGEEGLARAIAEGNALLQLSPSVVGDVKAAIKADEGHTLTLLQSLHAAAAHRTAAPSSLQTLPTVILAVDQAEQLFDAGISAESHAFLQQIGAILRSGGNTPQSEARARFIAIFTIRSDRYEPLQTAPELVGLQSVLFDRLRAMSLAQFKEVITGPAARTAATGRGVTFEPDLVNRLLAESARGADTLPLLSLTLQRLYEDYGASGTVRLEHYEAMGGLSDVIQNELESVLSSNVHERAKQLDVLHALFIPWLVTVNADGEPMARVARLSDLPAESASLIEALVDRRLLLRDLRGSDQVLQVAHESLLRHWAVLRQWLQQDTEDLKEIDRLEQAAVAWIRSGKKTAWLIAGERLTAAEGLLANPRYLMRLRSVSDFLSAARLSERRARTNRLVAAVVTLAALALGVWFANDSQRADTPPPLRANGAKLEETELAALLKARMTFERTRNPGGSAYPNGFHTAEWNRAGVVIDDVSRLIWQREGSPNALSTSGADEYVAGLNQQLHAGFGDWRLPTLEESLSLIETERRADGLYIDATFGRMQRYIWTADRDGSDERWSVDFQDASVGIGVTNFDSPQKGFVRAVRSGGERFSQIDMAPINNLPWEEAGILFWKESVKPPRSMTRRGVPFWLLGGPKAVFLTSVTLQTFRPTEAGLDVNVPNPLSAHVLINAGWLTEVYKNEKVGEIEYQFEDRVIRTDLVGWKTVREGWTAYAEEVLPDDSKGVVLTKGFFSEPQQRALIPGKDPTQGFGVIDMLSTDFGDAGVGRTLRRIVLRDTSTPKPWRDPRTNNTVIVDPGLAFMGITVKSRALP